MMVAKINIVILRYKGFLLYVLKFLGCFCIAFFGTLGIIGLSAPGGYYSSFVHNYLDYASWLRTSLLYGSKWLLSVFDYQTNVDGKFRLAVKFGYGVRIVYSCLGFGVMSFWIAFVAANNGTPAKKIQWIFGGLLLIWLINVSRISLLLAATNKHWSIPVFNHHTWFNIFAYLQVFVLIYFYDRSNKERRVIVNSPLPAIP